jgi:tetratricopeptide (TPR) repeat protein
MAGVTGNLSSYGTTLAIGHFRAETFPLCKFALIRRRLSCPRIPSPSSKLETGSSDGGKFAGNVNLFDLWDFGDPALSEERFREAADDAPTDEDEGLALSQVARALMLQGKEADARTTIGYAQDLIGDDGTAAGVQCLLERGRIENSSGNPTMAQPYFARALELGLSLGLEYEALDAAHMLAIAAPLEGQISFGLKALEMARKATGERAKRWVGPIVNNLGWSLMDAGRIEEALPCFRESLTFRLSQGVEGPIRVSRYSLGSVLRRLEEFEEALVFLREALATPGFDGYLNEEIGECLFGLGQADAAKIYFQQAYDQLTAETNLAHDAPERLARLLERA